MTSGEKKIIYNFQYLNDRTYHHHKIYDQDSIGEAAPEYLVTCYEKMVFYVRDDVGIYIYIYIYICMCISLIRTAHTEYNSIFLEDNLRQKNNTDTVPYLVVGTNASQNI